MVRDERFEEGCEIIVRISGCRGLCNPVVQPGCSLPRSPRPLGNVFPSAIPATVDRVGLLPRHH